MTRDIATEITQAIIEQIEAGLSEGKLEAPWHRGTADGLPMNATTGKFYSGVNVFLLGMAGFAASFTSQRWASFKQWKAAGASVRKGERGTRIVFYSSITKEEENAQSGETEEKTIRFLKTYTVFNADQVEGWQAPDMPADLTDRIDPIAAADAFVRGTGATIRHGGGGAYYSPGQDTITMPDRERFRPVGEASATEGYYSVLLHELTHWTGAKHRLDRLGEIQRFGDHKYAFEELIAELGAAFLCRKLGISSAPREDHAHYLASWLKCLKAHPRSLFKAAASAQRAVDFMDGLQTVELATAA